MELRLRCLSPETSDIKLTDRSWHASLRVIFASSHQAAMRSDWKAMSSYPHSVANMAALTT
eukprot:179588-Pyramimonas_sp.AAC.1